MVKRSTVVLEVIGSNPLAVKLFDNFYFDPKNENVKISQLGKSRTLFSDWLKTLT